MLWIICSNAHCMYDSPRSKSKQTVNKYCLNVYATCIQVNNVRPFCHFAVVNNRLRVLNMCRRQRCSTIETVRASRSAPSLFSVSKMGWLDIWWAGRMAVMLDIKNVIILFFTSIEKLRMRNVTEWKIVIYVVFGHCNT